MMNYQPMIASVIWFSLALMPVLTQVHAQGEPLQIITTPAATQPVIDGVIHAQEWSDGCKLEGTLHQVSLLSDTRPITFWVKADANNVYVAMRSTVREREWKWQGPTTWFDKGDSSFVIGLAPGTVNHGDKPSRYLLRVNLHDQKIAWEVTPQIKGVQLTYPHPKWLHKAVIKSGFNEDRTQWTMEASIPLASMNVDSVSSDATWGLLLARDYAAADPTAIVLSNDWRFGDGRGRIYGRAFYNHYRNEAQWAQLHFNANDAPSSVVVESNRSPLETPDVPDFAMLPFQKGAGLLVPDAELKRYGVYTSSGTLSKSTTATGYEPITNEFYAKLKIGTLPEVSKAVRSELIIRPLGSREALLTHDMPGLKPELNLRLTSTYPNAARSTVIEWVSPSDGLVDVNYDCRQGNSNMSDGVGFGLMYVNAQIPESRVLIARRQLVYVDGWVPFAVKQLAVKAGDKIQLLEDKWGNEGNDIGRLRGSLTLTDSNGTVTTYSPAADFAMEQGGTNGVWFYRFDNDVIPNVDGVYPQLLWQSHPSGYDGWLWFDDNEGKLNPWKGNANQHAGRAWGSVQLEQNNVERVERFKLPVLTPGVYEVEANVYADGDRLIGQAKQLFVRFDHDKDLPWMNNELGMSSKVLAPWTPMTAERDKNGLLVSCWGRTHQVNQGGLFEQINAKSADSVDPTTRDILASAIRIEMDRDGKTEILKPVGSVKQGGSENHKVEWQSSVGADGWKVQVDVDMAYDGYALHKLLITPPAAGATVDRIRLVIPIQPEQATHLHAAAGQWFRATVSAIALDAQMGQLWHSGRSHGMDNKTHSDNFGRMMAAGDFKPYVWVGGANRGLAFMADNDRGWVPDDSGKTHAIEVIREEGQVNLVLNLVARPFAFDKPRAIEFSLQATPVKPLAADFRADLARLTLATAFPGFDADGWDWNGSRFRINDYNLVDGHGSQPYPLNWDRNISKREAWEKRNTTFTPYQSQLNLMSYAEVDDPRMPAGKQVSDVYGYLFPHFAAGALEHGYLSITKPDLEYRLWCYQAWIKNAGLKGLYFDQTEPVLGANPAAGAGYMLDLHDRPELNGRIQPGYLLTNVRSFYQRLHTLFAEVGVEKPMIWLHTTDAVMISAFSFAGAMLEGENAPYLTPEEPWFSEKFSADRLQAFSNPAKLGVGAVWLSMFKRDLNWPDARDKQYVAMRSVHGTAMLYDYAPDWRYMPWGKLDLIQPATFHAYWDKATTQAFGVNDPNVLVSAYRQGKQLHVVIFNNSKQLLNAANIQVDLSALGLQKSGESLEIKDLIGWGDRQPGYVPESPLDWKPSDAGGTLTLDIRPHDYRLILITLP